MSTTRIPTKPTNPAPVRRTLNGDNSRVILPIIKKISNQNNVVQKKTFTENTSLPPVRGGCLDQEISPETHARHVQAVANAMFGLIKK